MWQKQTGFTLVELVVVIIILGILALVAIPRFETFSEDAHTSYVRDFSGELQNGIEFSNYRWRIEGSGPNTVTVDGANVDLNSAGYPGANTNSQAQCISTYNQIIKDAPATATVFEQGGEGFLVIGSGVFCFYIYQKDISPVRFVRYNTSLGIVERFGI